MTLSLDLAKQQCGVVNNDRDTLIYQYLKAAIGRVENYSGKVLAITQVEQPLTEFAPYIDLWYGPVRSITRIDYTDADLAPQTITDARHVGSRLFAPVAGWPTMGDRTGATVFYEAGWPEADVPAPLEHAVLVLVRDYFDSNGSMTGDAERAVKALCNPFRNIQV